MQEVNRLKPVLHAPLRDLVRDQLLEGIVEGRLRPGLRLTESELASQLGTSRVPVREALQQLATDGWVDLLPRQGATVHTPRGPEVENVFAVRAALESESARTAARVATPPDVESLYALVARGTALARSGDAAGASRANSDFHREIAEMTQNELLADMLQTLETRVRWYFSQVAAIRGVNSWIEHGRIVDAIAEGREDVAADEARRHTESTLAAYRAYLSDEPAT